MSTPREDGFRMPAEWAPHDGCWMIWPERPDNWRLNAQPGQAAFAMVAAAIARFEPVTMLVSKALLETARSTLPEAVRVVEMASNDSWARDVGPSFLVDGKGALAGVDWVFNAWGGLDEGLYAPWDHDDALAAKVLALTGARRYRAPNVLEGGAIHVDGEGTALTTEVCLLAANRNPDATKLAMEALLADYLGTTKLIWLGEGVPHDETGGHIDNLACFVRPGVVLLSWCDDPADLHYAVSRDAEARLLAARDAKGRSIEVVRVPMPTPMFASDEEASGVMQSDAGMDRHAGLRLAASYVNFYLANGAVIAPAFGVETDEPARAVFEQIFPEREIVMLPAREILLGGGNIHCITQQQPKTGTTA